MPTILGFAALFLLATDALNMDLSLLPGVSAKNLIIYLIAVVLALRMVVSRGSIMAAGPDAGRVHHPDRLRHRHRGSSPRCSSSIRTTTWSRAASSSRPGSSTTTSSSSCSCSACRPTEDGLKVIKGLLFGALLANIITILDAAGIISLGFRIREDGRTAGAIGESNQYAAFIILFLPATIAAAVAARGFAAAVLVWRHAGRLHDAGHDRIARWLRRPRHDVRGGRLSIPPSHFLQPHRRLGVRLADPAGADRVVLAIRQPARRTHDRDVGLHRRQHRVFGTQRHLGGPRSPPCSRIRSPSSPASDGMRTRTCRSSSRRTTTTSRCGSTSAWSACSAAPICCSRRSVARAARACAPRRRLRGQLIAFVLGTVGVCTAVFFVDLHKPWFYFWMYARRGDAHGVVRGAGAGRTSRQRFRACGVRWCGGIRTAGRNSGSRS